MAKPKWFRCDPPEIARLILEHGYASEDGRIWLSRDAAMPQYGEVCFRVQLPEGCVETYRDHEGFPRRYAFMYPGESIPPECFEVVE
jgi:hypothetical protein